VIDQLAGHMTERRSSDPLDLQLDRVRAAGAPTDPISARARPERRAWSSGAQILVVLCAGIALGPNALGILRDNILSLVDPVVPVALAALGVLVAFELGTALWMRARVLAAVSAQAFTAVGVVAAGTLAFMHLSGDSGSTSALMLVIALGICAAPSSAMGTVDPAGRSMITRLIDLDALPAIISGGLVIVAMREPDLGGAASITAQLVGIVLTVAIAGWLLLARTASETEQRVFGVATLLLLGGVADYLSLSALLAGLVAGTFWSIAGGAAREGLERDLALVQHPMVALILVVAGARLEFTSGTIGLAVAYVLLREVGKLTGSLVAVWIDPAISRSIATHLLTPGIVGVAFALNALRSGSPDMTAVLSVAVLGTIGSQLVAGLRQPEELA
jgi:hypothetical protein